MVHPTSSTGNGETPGIFFPMLSLIGMAWSKRESGKHCSIVGAVQTRCGYRRQHCVAIQNSTHQIGKMCFHPLLIILRVSNPQESDPSARMTHILMESTSMIDSANFSLVLSPSLVCPHMSTFSGRRLSGWSSTSRPLGGSSYW